MKNVQISSKFYSKVGAITSSNSLFYLILEVFYHRQDIALSFSVGNKTAFLIETDRRIMLIEKSADEKKHVVIQLGE